MKLSVFFKSISTLALLYKKENIRCHPFSINFFNLYNWIKSKRNTLSCHRGKLKVVVINF